MHAAAAYIIDSMARLTAECIAMQRSLRHAEELRSGHGPAPKRQAIAAPAGGAPWAAGPRPQEGGNNIMSGIVHCKDWLRLLRQSEPHGPPPAACAYGSTCKFAPCNGRSTANDAATFFRARPPPAPRRQ